MCRLMVKKNGWLLMVLVTMTTVVFAETSDQTKSQSGMSQHQGTQQKMQQQSEQMQHGMQQKSEQMKSHMKQQSDQMHKQHQEMMQKQRDEMAKMKKECNIAGRSGHLQSTDEILGMNLLNKQGQKLGNIEEVILDDGRQAVSYVVVDADGKMYPVPWKALGTGKDTYTLDITADSLRKAPSIQSLDSRQFKDSALRTKSDQYYQKQIKAEQDKNMAQRAMDWAENTAADLYSDEPTPMVYSANDIIGYEVQDQQGDDIGELSDIVFDTREGNLAYGLVSFGGVLGVGQKTAAVPWEAIQLESSRAVAQLQSDQQSLNDVVLKNGDISQLSEPQFARRVHSDFNQEPYWVVFGFIEPVGTEALSTAAWQADSAYNQNFNPKTVETVQGTVKKVGTFTPEQGAAKGLKLKVKTQDGKTMTVCAGPQQNYEQQKVRFKKGDQISVTGSKTTVDQKNVIIASQIKKGDQTLKLRNEQGKPDWQMQSQQSQQSSQDMSSGQSRQQSNQQDQQKQNNSGSTEEQQPRMHNDTPPRYY